MAGARSSPPRAGERQGRSLQGLPLADRRRDPRLRHVRARGDTGGQSTGPRLGLSATFAPVRVRKRKLKRCSIILLFCFLSTPAAATDSRAPQSKLIARGKYLVEEVA